MPLESEIKNWLPGAAAIFEAAQELTEKAFTEAIAAASGGLVRENESLNLRVLALENENDALKIELEEFRSKLSRPKAKGRGHNVPVGVKKRTIIPPQSQEG